MKFTKILALALAALMLLGIVVSCGNPSNPETTTPANTENNEQPKEATDRFAGKDHATVSDTLYQEVLGAFDTAYKAAKEAKTISERFALMAIAEAKLLESGVMLPSTSQGGAYAISRVVPGTINSTLWGNDSDRFYKALIVDTDKFLKASERDELKKLWNEKKGTGTYEAEARKYLEGKGYKLADTYTLGYTSDPQTWDAFNTYRAADSEAIVNTYDGLLEYNIENVQVPALAEALPTVSADGLTYTFKIRQGVVWVDSQGKEIEKLTANSFVAAMRHMLDAQGGLEYLVSGIIKNAAQYMAKEITDFSQVGVKATDDYTLVYTLEAPCSYFLSMLGYNIFAPMSDAYFKVKGGVYGVDEFDAVAEKDSYTYGKTANDIAYCGPYIVTAATAENTIVFEANAAYWNKDAVNLKKITWKFLDGKNATEAYDRAKDGEFAGAGLGTQALEKAKTDGLFNDYAYVSATDATSYPMFLNLYRAQYGNFNDPTVAPTTLSDAEKIRTNIAMANQNFRLAVCTALDRGAYNATTRGDELKLKNLVNSYTPGTFVFLDADVTVKINGTDKTFKAGTYYGEIMQAQIDADGYKIKVWDPTLDAGTGSSAGFDGWYNPAVAKEYLNKAIEELKAQGVEITAEKPITLEIPYYDINETYTNRANALKQSIEASTDKLIKVQLVKTGGENAKNWYYAGYYPESGDAMNYNIVDVCGWGPDYGDPQTYLDTMLPQAGGMAKNIGLY